MLLTKEVIFLKREISPPIKAVASTLVMGLGQILNRQYVKGLLYFGIYIFLILFGIPLMRFGIEDLITLGTVPMVQHSLFLMVYGILSLICLFFVIWFYVANILDAYNTGKKISNGTDPKDLRQSFKTILSKKAPYFFLAPCILAVCLIVILPLVFSVMLGFTNYDLYHQPPAHLVEWVGLKNFVSIFSIKSWAVTFWSILLWTIEFTILTSVLPYALGIIIAVLLNNPRVKGQRIIKTIFILPWAIPSYISIMVWRGMFDTNYGIINGFLQSAFGMEPVPWMQNTFFARMALVIVSIWIGFSFPMMLADGIIKSIPSDVYEAAVLDGASPLKKFTKITLPLLMFSIAPLFIMSLAGAFNNFNLIYLFTKGEPVNINYQGAGSTDILISWLFKMTFNNSKYNYASAISMIIFLFIATLSIYNFRRTKSFKEEDMMQ